MSQKTAKHIRRIERKVDNLQQSQRTFEECLARVEYEQSCQDNVRKKAQADRQSRRELEAEYAVKHWKTMTYAAIIAAILVLIVAIVAVQDAKAAEPADELMISEAETITHSEDDSKNTPVFVMNAVETDVHDEIQEDFENEKIEAALLEKANVIEDCEVTWYTEATCGKTPDHPAYGVTRSGLPVEEHLTCAVDPKVIPLYSDVWVEYADGTIEHRWATDTGVYGNSLDIYTPDYDYAMQCGRQWLTVYWLPPVEVA